MKIVENCEKNLKNCIGYLAINLQIKAIERFCNFELYLKRF